MFVVSGGKVRMGEEFKVSVLLGRDNTKRTVISYNCLSHMVSPSTMCLLYGFDFVVILLFMFLRGTFV